MALGGGKLGRKAEEEWAGSGWEAGREGAERARSGWERLGRGEERGWRGSGQDQGIETAFLYK